MELRQAVRWGRENKCLTLRPVGQWPGPFVNLETTFRRNHRIFPAEPRNRGWKAPAESQSPFLPCVTSSGCHWPSGASKHVDGLCQLHCPMLRLILSPTQRPSVTIALDSFNPKNLRKMRDWVSLSISVFYISDFHLSPSSNETATLTWVIITIIIICLLFSFWFFKNDFLSTFNSSDFSIWMITSFSHRSEHALWPQAIRRAVAAGGCTHCKMGAVLPAHSLCPRQRMPAYYEQIKNVFSILRLTCILRASDSPAAGFASPQFPAPVY